MRLNTRGEYPKDWPTIAKQVKDDADWRCVRCGHLDDLETGYVLTVHHMNGNKADCVWWNLMALCQRCHLSFQARVDPEQPYILEHSDWCKPYMAGFYSWKYRGRYIDREEAVANLEDLLALECKSL